MTGESKLGDRHRSVLAGMETDSIFETCYGDLRTIAKAHLAAGDTLNTTALVHELYMRLSERDDLSFTDRRSFFAYAARSMRHLLVDRARARLREKRGGREHHVDWDTVGADSVWVYIDAALELDQLLRQLSEEDPRSAEVLELHYFAGLSGDQVAEMLGVHRRTVVRDLDFARAFIKAHWQP
jgi:RNA polymerase sigma factor (TIGR02999 family)